MESTWRRTLSAVFIFLFLSDVFSHCRVQAGPLPPPGNFLKDVNNECLNGNSRSPGSQLMNTLFTVAAANGVLPDLLPAFKTSSILQEERRRPNIGPLEELRYQTPIVDVPIVSSPYQQGPNIPPVFLKPEISCPSPSPPFQVVSGTYLPPGQSPTMIPSLKISHDINPILPPPSPPIVPLQPFSFPQSVYGFPRPLPLLQPQPILESLPTITPILSDINSGIEITTIPTAEILIESDKCIGENDFVPTIVSDDFGQLPINLHINMPAQNNPAPRVTVITAAPTPAVAPANEYGSPNLMYPPPMPPIIVEGSKSRMRNWLPILMIALLNDGCQGRGGSGSCGCCCPCNCGGSNIPIPYPIPIPTNNPIINSSRARSLLCRRRGDGPNDN